MAEASRVFIEARKSREYRKTYEEEALILAHTWLLDEIMRKNGVIASELARRLGKSRAYVSQLLSGPSNMTLRTVAEVFFDLGYRIVPRAEGLGEWSEEVAYAAPTVMQSVKYVSNQDAQGVEYDTQAEAA